MKGFPTRSPADLEDRPRQQQWLVDGLWGRQAVGIVGGEPKCSKSFLALDLAVAVAAGVPCLRRFETDQPGPVLMFAAEDAGHIVRRRLQGISAAAGADFQNLDIAVIDVPVLRLDHRNDRQRLEETVGHARRAWLSTAHSQCERQQNAHRRAQAPGRRARRSGFFRLFRRLDRGTPGAWPTAPPGQFHRGLATRRLRRAVSA